MPFEAQKVFIPPKTMGPILKTILLLLIKEKQTYQGSGQSSPVEAFDFEGGGFHLITNVHIKIAIQCA